MVRFRCKDWLLHIDLEGTKEYYRNFKFELEEEQQQIWENYKEYCKYLSNVECKFFDSLGITPECCNVSSFGVDKKGQLSVWGSYRIKGTFEHIMEEVVIPAEEFVEKKLYLPKNQSKVHNGLHIGSYGITFCYPDSLFNPCPEDLEEGWIQFEFWLEYVPWLLDKPCTLKEYKPPRWWQFRKRYQECIESKRLQEELKTECIHDIESYFRKQKIRFVKIEEERIEPLRKYWLKRFTPKGAEKQAQKVCSKYGTYLWHLFSFEIAKTSEREEAQKAFKSTSLEKPKAWIFFQYENIGWKIDNASLLDPLELRTVVKDIFADFYITASDFSWTYAYTHEVECGPYFYERENNENVLVCDKQ